MTVAFLHIAKCAGTSYGRFLADLLPGKHLFPPIGITMTAEQFQQHADPESLRQYTLVAGHFDYGLVRRAPFLRPATLLRDPVDRLLSQYHQFAESDDEYLRDWRMLIEGRRMGVEQFIRHPMIQEMLGQVQTAQVAGYVSSGIRPPSLECVAAEAREHLAEFAHVGLYEDLVASVALARLEFGSGITATLPTLNPSSASATLAPEIRAEVEDRLGLDSGFYRWAVTHFEQRLARHGIARTAAPSPTSRLPQTFLVPEVAKTTRRPRFGRSHVGTSHVGTSHVGDWIELQREPRAGTELGARFGEPPFLSALTFDAVVGRAGTTFVTAETGGTRADLDRVGIPAGIYDLQVAVSTHPESPDRQGWTVAFEFDWLDDPPIPWHGRPGAPDVSIRNVVAVPLAAPRSAQPSVTVSSRALIRAPRNGGHLCVLFGSDRAVTTSPGDRVTLLIVRVG